MDDLIRRQDAIDYFNVVSSDGDFVSKCVDYLKEVKPAQRWIPCSERTPEEYEEVWVTIRGSDMIVCKDGETLAEAAERVWKENIRVSIGFYGSDGWYSIDGYPSMVSPVAWMPMNEPEPYEG